MKYGGWRLENREERSEKRAEGRERVETEVQKLIDALADLREKANVNACFGEPVTIEGCTVIPVAEIAYGFGLRGGYGTEAEQQTPQETSVGGSGGVGGVRARPLAVVEVTPERTWVEPIIDEQELALAGALLTGWSVFWLARALAKIFGRQE
jgi:uncharacterized spore protein YtfJ